MKVVPLVLVALLMASPLAIVALDAMGVGPAFEASPPDWESGYSWTWDTTGRGRVVGEGFGIVRYESETLRADATRHAEVLNTTFEQDGAPVDLLLEAFRVDRVSHGDEVIYDGADGAASGADEGFADAFFCITPCGTFLAAYDENANPSFGAHAFDMFGADKIQLFDFPLTRGKTWTLISVQEDGMLFEIEAKAADNEYIDIPGHGPMATVRIDATLTDASKEAIKRLVRDEAEAEGLDLDLDFDLGATYWYAPQVQNLVKLDLDGFISARATGYGAAGAGRVDFHFDQILRDYSLQAKPERSVDEAQALAGVTHAARGAAPVLSSEPLDFQVGASALAVQAERDETVSFGLVTGPERAKADEQAETRLGAAPEGSTVRWTHSAPTQRGSERTSVDGDRAEFTFDSPGLHIVRAEVYDLQGRLRGTDQVVIEAYTLKTGTLDAAPDPIRSGRSADEFYVAPGARSATVLLETDGLARGVLTIHGHDEQHEAVDLVADSVEIPVKDASAGDRMISWEEEVRVGALAYTLEVRYDRGSVAQVYETSNNGGGPLGLLELLWGGA